MEGRRREKKGEKKRDGVWKNEKGGEEGREG